MKSTATLLTVAILLTTVSSTFLPQRLRIVDSNPSKRNYMVRGNLPISQGRFQIDELKASLSSLTGLGEYRLVVYSFINFLTAKETRNRYIEQKFFKKNPKAGEYRHKLVLGSVIDPTVVPEWLLGFMLSSDWYSWDRMPAFIEQLRQQMTDSRNTIIYFHCSAGFDRTGFVSGAYKIRYLGYSLQQAYDENMKIIRPVRNHTHFNCLFGIRWYCLELEGVDCSLKE